MHGMAHAAPLSALGAVGGGLGVAIAVYLQFVTERRVPPRYVLGYFLFGAILLLGHAGALPGFTAPRIALAAWLAVALSILGQLAGFVWLMRTHLVESPAEVAHNVIEECGRVLDEDSR